MRKMYDSTDANDIPLDGQLVAGYIDGTYAWPATAWLRFGQDTRQVRIAVLATTNDGHVLDVESGDATPTEAVAWTKMRRKAGQDPTIYTSVGEWAAVLQAFKDAGEPPPHFWIASWPAVDTDPGNPTPIPGAIAKQYAHPPGSGGHYDTSSVADYWPGVDPKPIVVVPSYVGQSVEEIHLEQGQVAIATARYVYPNGTRDLPIKVVGYSPGVHVLFFYPPADPDADPTQVLSARPAVFVVTVL